jgi:hypothetical protein
MVRSLVADELRNQMVEHIDRMVRYWAELPGLSVEDRCDGVAFSILTMLDGASALPRFTLAAESDRKHEDGVVINADRDLHDVYTAFRRENGK